MPRVRAVVGCRLVKSWSIADFVLVWMGGLFGAQVLLLSAGRDSSTGSLVLLSLAGSYIGYAGTIWLLSRRKSDADLGLRIEPGDIAYLALGLFLQLAMALLLQPLAELLLPDGGQPQGVAEELLNSAGSTTLQIVLFGAAVLLSPVFEELVFRGVLLKAVIEKSRGFVMTVTATVFALVHILDLDLDNLAASAAVVLPPIFLLGLLLAWLTLRTGRLGPAIFVHSGWNLLAAIVLLVPSELLDSVN